MEINEYVVKLTGKASIPEAVELGKNYKVTIEGSITSKSESDNQDGTSTMIYKLEPVRVEFVTETGETIKARDTRSSSQLMRALIWKRWKDAASDIDFDTFYTNVINQAMFEIDQLIDRYEKRKS